MTVIIVAGTVNFSKTIPPWIRRGVSRPRGNLRVGRHWGKHEQLDDGLSAAAVVDDFCGRDDPPPSHGSRNLAWRVRCQCDDEEDEIDHHAGSCFPGPPGRRHDGDAERVEFSTRSPWRSSPQKQSMLADASPPPPPCCLCRPLSWSKQGVNNSPYMLIPW
jgi:hypothetical protein